MNYHEFVRIVEKEINNNLEGGMHARLHTAIKNNNQKRIGLIMERPDVNISPTIYLEDFYMKYHKGEGIEEISKEIMMFYEKVKCEKSWNTELFSKYEKIRNRIVFKVVNTGKNQALLDEVPHVDFLDLSILFYALLDVNREGMATMLIHNENLVHWGVSKQELLMTAIENTEVLLPAQLFTMKHVLLEIMDPLTPEVENLLESGYLDDCEDMFILSNSLRSFGAACMMYPGMLKSLGDLLGTDYYLLPSSVHEVILVAKQEGMYFREMSRMVQEVNNEQVAAEEVLSDHAYFYSREKEKLLMAEC